MTSLTTSTNVWSNAVSEMGRVNKRDVPAVAAVISRTMDRAIDKLLTPVASGVTSALHGIQEKLNETCKDLTTPSLRAYGLNGYSAIIR
jgi:hypothetical protein